jgi:hypothetical protein
LGYALEFKIWIDFIKNQANVDKLNCAVKELKPKLLDEADRCLLKEYVAIDQFAKYLNVLQLDANTTCNILPMTTTCTYDYYLIYYLYLLPIICVISYTHKIGGDGRSKLRTFPWMVTESIFAESSSPLLIYQIEIFISFYV